MNVIKKRLIKKADTQNIHHVPNDVSIGLFKDLYETLINEGYRSYDFNSDIGAAGYFAYKDNTIYVFELFNFIYNKKNKNQKEKATMLKKPESIILCHELDNNGNIVNSTVERCLNTNVRDAVDKILHNNTTTLTGYQILKSETFDDALNEIKNL